MKLLLPLSLVLVAFAAAVSAGLLVSKEPAVQPEAAAPLDASDVAPVEEEAQLVQPTEPAAPVPEVQQEVEVPQLETTPEPEPVPEPPQAAPEDPMARYLAMDRRALEAERASVAARQSAKASALLAQRMELGLFDEVVLPEGEKPATTELDPSGFRLFHSIQLEKTEEGRSTWHVARLTVPEAPELQPEEDLLGWIDWRLTQLPPP